MSRYDLPNVVKFLEVQSGIANHLLLGIRERHRPPAERESQIRLKEFNLDARWIDVAHGTAIGVSINVGVVKLLPTVKLFGVNDNQQFRRFPIDLKVTLKIVSVPPVQHSEQYFVDQLPIRFISRRIGGKRVEYPPPLILCQDRHAEAEQGKQANSAKYPWTHDFGTV